MQFDGKQRKSSLLPQLENRSFEVPKLINNSQTSQSTVSRSYQLANGSFDSSQMQAQFVEKNRDHEKLNDLRRQLKRNRWILEELQFQTMRVEDKCGQLESQLNGLQKQITNTEKDALLCVVISDERSAFSCEFALL